MNWNIKDSGDIIEKLAVEVISDTSIISNYNKFWGRYIGCVKGKPVSIPELSSENDELRLMLGQWCYTLLQNHTFIYFQKNIPLDIKPNNKKAFAKSFMYYNELTHLLYNSTEIINKFNNKFPSENISVSSLDGFRSLRNHLAHNIRPLIKLKNNTIYVPKNFDWFKGKSADEIMIWSYENTFSDLEYFSLKEYKNFVEQNNKQLLLTLLDKSIKIVNDFIPESKEIITKVENPPLNGFSASGSVSLSGTTIN